MFLFIYLIVSFGFHYLLLFCNCCKIFLQFAFVFKFYYFCDQGFAIIIKLLKILQYPEYYKYSLIFLFYFFYIWHSKFNCFTYLKFILNCV